MLHGNERNSLNDARGQYHLPKIATIEVHCNFEEKWQSNNKDRYLLRCITIIYNLALKLIVLIGRFERSPQPIEQNRFYEYCFCSTKTLKDKLGVVIYGTRRGGGTIT